MNTVLQNDKYNIEIVEGDTLSLRLNLRDSNGALVDVNVAGNVIRMGIKEDELDESYVIPVKTATLYTYAEGTQEYTIEFNFSSADTTATQTRSWVGAYDDGAGGALDVPASPTFPADLMFSLP